MGPSVPRGTLPRAMEHDFTGPSYTIGIEEELMILDRESLDLSNSIETLLDATSGGEVRPELMESVLEVATSPTRNTAEAGPQLKGLRRAVIQAAREKGLRIGSAGTPPLALWGGQRIVPRPPHPAPLPPPPVGAPPGGIFCP